MRLSVRSRMRELIVSKFKLFKPWEIEQWKTIEVSQGNECIQLGIPKN